MASYFKFETLALWLYFRFFHTFSSTSQSISYASLFTRSFKLSLFYTQFMPFDWPFDYWSLAQSIRQLILKFNTLVYLQLIVLLPLTEAKTLFCFYRSKSSKPTRFLLIYLTHLCRSLQSCHKAQKESWWHWWVLWV